MPLFFRNRNDRELLTLLGVLLTAGVMLLIGGALARNQIIQQIDQSGIVSLDQRLYACKPLQTRPDHDVTN